MTPFTAKEIDLQLSLYDMQVRRAIEAGTILQYMAQHSADIVSLVFFLYPTMANQPTESLLQVLQEPQRPRSPNSL
jgi:hypothetical protein